MRIYIFTILYLVTAFNSFSIELNLEKIQKLAEIEIYQFSEDKEKNPPEIFLGKKALDKDFFTPSDVRVFFERLKVVLAADDEDKLKKMFTEEELCLPFSRFSSVDDDTQKQYFNRYIKNYEPFIVFRQRNIIYLFLINKKTRIVNPISFFLTYTDNGLRILNRRKVSFEAEAKAQEVYDLISLGETINPKGGRLFEIYDKQKDLETCSFDSAIEEIKEDNMYRKSLIQMKRFCLELKNYSSLEQFEKYYYYRGEKPFVVPFASASKEQMNGFSDWVLSSVPTCGFKVGSYLVIFTYDKERKTLLHMGTNFYCEGETVKFAVDRAEDIMTSTFSNKLREFVASHYPDHFQGLKELQEEAN